LTALDHFAYSTSETLRSLLQSDLYYVVVTDLDGNYRYANSHFFKRFKYEPTELIGSNCLQTIIEKDWARCEEVVRECLHHRGRCIPITLTKPMPDGKMVYSQWEFSTLTDEDGEPQGILCIGHDITEKQAALNNYQEYAQQLDTVLASVTDGFFVLDRHWRFLRVNQAFLEAFTTTEAEVIGYPLMQLYPPFQNFRAYKAFEKALRDQQAVKFEEEHQGRWFAVSVYPSLEHLTIFFQNITERRLAEQQLKQQLERIRQFSFTTSHELRHEIAKIQLLWQADSTVSQARLTGGADSSEIGQAIESIQRILKKLNEQLNVAALPYVPSPGFSLQSVEEVCFIDDDQVMNTYNPRIVQRLLPAARLLTFETIEEGLSHLREHSGVRRCIFLDLNFPGRSGWDFLEAYRSDDIQDPIVILSSSIDPREQERALRYPMVVAFLTKPLNLEQLHSLF